MASLIGSTSWGGMAGGPLRCSVCGRREAAVEHLVRARGVHICDRCVAQASEALAVVAPSQKVVRIRPTPAHVGDREAAASARAELGYVDFLRARYDRAERRFGQVVQQGS